MNKARRYIPMFAAVCAMITLILDSKTAIQASADAIELCARTAIPSLFPFFVLSGLLVPYASELHIPWLGKILQVPSGFEAIFLLGCLGGYPVGAQCVAQSYTSGKFDKAQAQRMLGFCTNCGPAFLFGIVASAFSDPWAPFAVMLIGILSAVLVGALWPGVSAMRQDLPDVPKVTVPQAVQQAMRSMSSVCAWIILGKVLLAFASKWVLWRFPDEATIILTGLMELTNGCLVLTGCTSEGLRLIIACASCSFGGLCVAMQAASICSQVKLSPKFYLPQKALQAGIAAALAAVYCKLSLPAPLRLMILAVLCIFSLILCKKTVEFPVTLMYNKASKGGM